MKNRTPKFKTNLVANDRSAKARAIDPQLIAELLSAITACRASPLVPSCIGKLADAGDVTQDLRREIESLKRELPIFLLKSSSERIAELAARLKTCTEYAQKVAELGPAVKRAATLLTGYDEQVLGLSACVQEIDAEIMSEM